jgi:hypothetical protein
MDDWGIDEWKNEGVLLRSPLLSLTARYFVIEGRNDPDWINCGK